MLSLSALAVNHSLCGKTEVSIAIEDCKVPFDVYACKNLMYLGFGLFAETTVRSRLQAKNFLKVVDVTLHLTERLSPLSFFNASRVNILQLPSFTEIMVPCKTICNVFGDGSDVYVERNEAFLGKYDIMCGNRVTKTFGKFGQVTWSILPPPLSVYLWE